MTPSLPTFITVLCAVPNGFTGGLVITCASVYSHAARNSAESVKTVRFAVIITALTLGFQLGMFIGGQIFAFSQSKHFSVFIVSAIFLASCLVYLWAVIPLGDEIRNATRQELTRVSYPIANYSAPAYLLSEMLSLINYIVVFPSFGRISVESTTSPKDSRRCSGSDLGEIARNFSS